MNRKFAISDIHGCRKTFEALLDKVAFSSSDELYLLGDYIDRGPDSKGVIDFIWKLKSENHSVHCLRGNHEEMLLSEIKSDGIWLRNDATMKSFGVTSVVDIPKIYRDFLASLHWYLEVDEYLLVHAGLNFRSPQPLSDNFELVWIRNWYDDIDHDWLNGRIIVHGHTPQHRTTIWRSVNYLDAVPAIPIDNGCVFEKIGWGHLCAFELTERKLEFQPCVD